MKLISTNNKPTKDGIFQYIFGREITKDLTDSFIKSLHEYINEKKVLNNIKIQSEVSLEKLNINNKISRLDVLAEYDEEIFCIEMQNKYKKSIYKRARVYAAKYEDMEVIHAMSKKNNNIKRALKYVCPIPEEQQERTLQRFHENALIEQLFDRTDARDEGIEIGKKESLLDFTKKMLIKKYSIQDIIELTDLSEAEINELAKSI